MKKAAALFCCVFLFCTAALAQSKPTGAPEDLAKWRDWVLYGQEQEYYCPTLGEERVCAWPVALEMDFNSDGGRFTLTADLLTDGAAALPGGEEAWPVEVTDAAGGEVAVLRQLNARGVWSPKVWLPAGRHILSGHFQWRKLPETITVPFGYLLDVRVEGERLDFPAMEADYANGSARLWLKQAAEEEAPQAAQSADSLSITVNRLITDSQPMIIINRFRLTVTGQAREVILEKALLPDTRATYLESPLPAQLKGDNVRVKVKPGVYEIVLESRSQNRSESLGPAPESAQWGREFWAFQAQPQLRLAEISGAEQIDASQADIYAGWKDFPIYAPEPGATLTFTDLRRGDPEAQPDQLRLARECWLDYDGGGLSCRDQLSGLLSRQWHLNTSRPFILAQATLDGQGQVITRQIDSKGEEAPGLQLRKGALNLTADLRIDEFSGTLPASGWDHDVETGAQKINLPPGYKLFHAQGADALGDNGHGAGSWTGAWTTLDFFLVLIISIAVWKLYGWRWGLLSLAALIFCYQEQMAPRMVFLHLLACAALLRLLPPTGNIRLFVRIWRSAALVVLLLFSAFFLISQARISMYPQLENPRAWYGESIYSIFYGGHSARYVHQAAPPAPAPMAEPDIDVYTDFMAQGVVVEDEEIMQLRPVESASEEPVPPNMAAAKAGRSLEAPRQQPEKSLAKSFVAPTDSSVRKNAQSYAAPPDAKVQNSLARPDWNWRAVRLYYNGSVSADQTVELFFISPTLGRFLGLLRIALMGIFTVMMVTGGRIALPGRAPAAAGTLVLALAVLLVPAPSALAQGTPFPSREMLEEFKNRLIFEQQGAPADFPAASFPRATLRFTQNSLILEMEVEAGRPTVWPLPLMDQEFFRYTRVSMAESALPLAGGRGGQLYTHIPAGRHRVALEGRLRLAAGRDNFQLSFIEPALPMFVQIAESGPWRVEGLEPDGRLRGTALSITNTEGAAAAAPDDQPTSQTLEPFFIVNRTISLGLEWQVYTTVSRLVASDAPVSLRLPLIPGEEPMGAAFRREGEHMTVNFAPGIEHVTWISRLETVPEITLKAAEGNFTESWALDASSLWRVKYEGLAPIHTINSGYWQPSWRPWPGEELRLAIDRPQPVPGEYRVIDKARLTLEAAENMRNFTLNFTVRGSQAGPYSFTLPKEAKVKSFTVDGAAMPLAPAGASADSDRGPTLTAPLSAGGHDILVIWTDEKPIGAAISTPSLDLGVDTANIALSVRLAEDRWVLWTRGPLNGPAVQFWPLLAILLLASVFLAKFKTPLSRLSWFLLGLGLIQLHIVGAMLVASWLIALGYRAERGANMAPDPFNFFQIALSLWTIISLCLIYSGIQYGLLSNPDMLIAGGGSYGQHLAWFIDRAEGPWPVGTVYSLSLWCYKAVMLLWSLWLAVNLIRWLKWGWKAFSSGCLWKKSKKSEQGGDE